MPLTPRPPRRQARAGFTLLEVMIAMGIIGFAFVGLLGLHARNIGMTIRDQNLTRATLLSRHIISEIQYKAQVEGIESVSSSGGNFEGYPGFRYETEVESTDLDMIRRVVVRVIWDERYPNACRVLYFVRGEVL